MRELHIGDTRVADDTEAYVIAEIGHNHGGSLDKAEELFRQAAASGASAAKLQKRDNQALFTKAMYNEPYTGRNSYGPTYGAHREALEFGRREYVHLAGVAAELGIDFISTAFDLPSVDFLAELDLPAIKIASADLTNTPLLAYAAKSGKPLIVSTGGADMSDVRRAMDTILPITTEVTLLQCTAVYPATPQDLNLAVIDTYRAEFPDVVIGFSGHDLGPEASWIAYARGARVIEKHYTLDRGLPGSDHKFSLDTPQLARLVEGLAETRAALGSPVKACSETEAPAIRKMGKKLVAARDLPAGHELTEADITFKSPGDGLKPYQLDVVVGRVLQDAIDTDGDITLAVLVPEDPESELDTLLAGADSGGR
ncbi:N-acetylneuraminate synthase/sialic acid synthase [Amycolatopsis xylanica]|uniref:N-acetylneuraminate synthase/sialic acid synthase n=1 Tax=Amycolatopsis xylanica TaxID=589385 RepID=A0A1H3EZL7_9PSEU|nr:N-acetylneuraminate synthase family protein [Amycolatopsis xylanica]SDX83344.1 N-acetylneuraminate synthase/sialic acid synthase [Amycolatopsis xylanica]